MPRNSPIRKPQSSHLLIRWSRPRAWRSKAPKVRGQTMLLHQLPGCVPRTKSFSWIRVVPLTHQLKLPKTVILQTLSSRQHCHPEHIRCTQCKLREGSRARIRPADPTHVTLGTSGESPEAPSKYICSEDGQQILAVGRGGPLRLPGQVER